MEGELDVESSCQQLLEIEEWLEENELGDVLHGRAELAAILERISVLHLRVVP